MSYRNTNKIIWQYYRMVRSIIWSHECIDIIKFRTNIMQLITIVYSFIILLYSTELALMRLNDYYVEMCIDEMHERLRLEMNKFS